MSQGRDLFHILKKDPKCLLLAFQRIVTIIQADNDFWRPSGQPQVQSRANFIIRSGWSVYLSSILSISESEDSPASVGSSAGVYSLPLWQLFFLLSVRIFLVAACLFYHYLFHLPHSPNPVIWWFGFLQDDLSTAQIYDSYFLSKNMPVANLVPAMPFCSTGNWKTTKRSLCVYVYKKVFSKARLLLWCLITLKT